MRLSQRASPWARLAAFPPRSARHVYSSPRTKGKKLSYLQPPRLAVKVVNPLAMRIGGRRVVTLVVAGRRSGVLHRVPLVALDYEGAKYLVSARGEAEWVKNLRRAGRAELVEGRRSRTFFASEVPAERRPPIIAAYRAKAGRSVAALFAKLPDHEDHPVFELC